MGLKEDWGKLKGHTKMFLIGGGGVALFFLYTAIKNNQAQSQAIQQAATNSAPVDSSGALDTMTQNFQDLQTQNQQQLQQMQDALNQNKSATQSQINTLLGKMGDIQKALNKPTPIPDAPQKPPPAAYSHPIKGPTHPVVTKPISKPTASKPAPKPVPKKPTAKTYTVKKGDTLSQIGEKTIGNYYHGGKQTLLKLNPQIKDPNKIYAGEKINY